MAKYHGGEERMSGRRRKSSIRVLTEGFCQETKTREVFQTEAPACAKAEMRNGTSEPGTGRMQGSTSYTPVPLQPHASGLTLNS